MFPTHYNFVKIKMQCLAQKSLTGVRMKLSALMSNTSINQVNEGPNGFMRRWKGRILTNSKETKASGFSGVLLASFKLTARTAKVSGKL